MNRVVAFLGDFWGVLQSSELESVGEWLDGVDERCLKDQFHNLGARDASFEPDERRLVAGTLVILEIVLGDFSGAKTRLEGLERFSEGVFKVLEFSLNLAMGFSGRASSIRDGIQLDDSLRFELGMLRGFLLFRVGNFEGAEACFTTCVRHDSECFLAQLYLAKTFVRRNMYDQAIPILEALDKGSQKTDIRAVEQLAKSYSGNGYNPDGLEKGIALLDGALKRHDRSQHGLILQAKGKILGFASKERGLKQSQRKALMKRSQQALEKVFKLDPNNDRVILSLGISLIWTKGRQNLQRGVALLRRVVEINPYSASGFSHLGLGLMKQDDIPGAMDAYRKSLEFRPQHGETLYGLARLYAQGGEWKEALRCYALASRSLFRGDSQGSKTFRKLFKDLLDKVREDSFLLEKTPIQDKIFYLRYSLVYYTFTGNVTRQRRILIALISMTPVDDRDALSDLFFKLATILNEQTGQVREIYQLNPDRNLPLAGLLVFAQALDNAVSPEFVQLCAERFLTLVLREFECIDDQVAFVLDSFEDVFQRCGEVFRLKALSGLAEACCVRFAEVPFSKPFVLVYTWLSDLIQDQGGLPVLTRMDELLGLVPHGRFETPELESQLRDLRGKLVQVVYRDALGEPIGLLMKEILPTLRGVLDQGFLACMGRRGFVAHSQQPLYFPILSDFRRTQRRKTGPNAIDEFKGYLRQRRAGMILGAPIDFAQYLFDLQPIFPGREAQNIWLRNLSVVAGKYKHQGLVEGRMVVPVDGEVPVDMVDFVIRHLGDVEGILERLKGF